MPCSTCGRMMWRGRTSLPEGEATCRPCRKVARVALLEAIQAQRVARTTEATVRPARKRTRLLGSATSRGYGYVHQQMRRKLLSELIPGTPCGFCTEPMYVDQPLDLDHSDPTLRAPGVPGDRLTHTHCNRRTNVGQTLATCGICGTTYRPHPRTHTCSRACGWERRRRNTAAA